MGAVSPLGLGEIKRLVGQGHDGFRIPRLDASTDRHSEADGHVAAVIRTVAVFQRKAFDGSAHGLRDREHLITTLASQQRDEFLAS